MEWISINERTPVAYMTGNFDGKKSDLVLTKNIETGKYKLAHLYEGFLDGNHFKEWCDEEGFEITKPTHWIELPLLF